jgi:hypothetical protein
VQYLQHKNGMRIKEADITSPGVNKLKSSNYKTKHEVNLNNWETFGWSRKNMYMTMVSKCVCRPPEK